MMHTFVSLLTVSSASSSFLLWVTGLSASFRDTWPLSCECLATPSTCCCCSLDFCLTSTGEGASWIGSSSVPTGEWSDWLAWRWAMERVHKSAVISKKIISHCCMQLHAIKSKHAWTTIVEQENLAIILIWRFTCDRQNKMLAQNRKCIVYGLLRATCRSPKLNIVTSRY